MNLERWLMAAEAPLPPGALDLLNSLKDVHEPPPPGIWPLAWGWWVVIVLVSGAFIFSIVEWRRRHRLSAPVRAAFVELDGWRACAHDRAPRDAADELAALLRRVALVRYPRALVAQLTGDAWLSFLDRTSESDAFSRGPARILGNDRYAPDVTLDTETVASLAQRWLRAHRLGPAVDAGALAGIRDDHAGAAGEAG